MSRPETKGNPVEPTLDPLDEGFRLADSLKLQSSKLKEFKSTHPSSNWNDQEHDQFNRLRNEEGRLIGTLIDHAIMHNNPLGIQATIHQHPLEEIHSYSETNFTLVIPQKSGSPIVESSQLHRVARNSGNTSIDIRNNLLQIGGDTLSQNSSSTNDISFVVQTCKEIAAIDDTILSGNYSHELADTSKLLFTKRLLPLLRTKTSSQDLEFALEEASTHTIIRLRSRNKHYSFTVPTDYVRESSGRPYKDIATYSVDELTELLDKTNSQVVALRNKRKRGVPLTPEEKEQFRQNEDLKSYLFVELLRKNKAGTLPDSITLYAMLGKGEKIHEFSSTNIGINRSGEKPMHAYSSLRTIKSAGLVKTGEDMDGLVAGLRKQEEPLSSYLRRSCSELRDVTTAIEKERLAINETKSFTRLNELNRLQSNLIIDRLIKPDHENILPPGHSVKIIREVDPRRHQDTVAILVTFPEADYHFRTLSPERLRTEVETGRSFALAINAVGGYDAVVQKPH